MMSIYQILISIFSILAIIFIALIPKEKRIWLVPFIINICLQIYFNTDRVLRTNTIKKLNEKIDDMSLTAPVIDLEGKIVLDSGFTGPSVASETLEKIRELYNKKNYGDAYDMTKSFVKKMPKFGMGYYFLGTIEASIGDDDSSAEANLNKAINLGLKKYFEAWAYNNLAVIKQKQGKMEDVISLLEKGVKSDPTIKEIKEYLDKLRLIQSQK